MSDPLLLASGALAIAGVHAVWLLRAHAALAGSAARSVSGSQGPWPRLTVILPVRDEAKVITEVLQHLYAQDMPRDRFEVLVVDDHSTDGTAERVRSMMDHWPQLRLLPLEERTGKKTAISLAVAQASHGHLLVTDADAVGGPSRLTTLAAHWAVDPVAMWLMPVRVKEEGGLLAWIQQEEQAALLAVAAATAAIGRPMLANGANMAFTREAFLRSGGYAGDRWASGDDIFLLRRMARSGARIQFLLDRAVMVEVPAERTWSAFVQQRLRWAGKMRAVGGAWTAVLALAVPWLLVVISAMLLSNARIGQGVVASIGLLVTAWVFWITPILRLSATVWAFLDEGARPHPVWRTLSALAVFCVYAPCIALLSLFWRPRWKGRRV